MRKLPAIFEKDASTLLRVVYTGNPEKPDVFFNATSVEQLIGAKNPAGSTTNRVATVIGRIRQYLASHPELSHLEEGTKVDLIGSVKPAVIVADDGVYKVIGVKSSHSPLARTSYYYNAAAMFYVLNTSMTDDANVIQHWVNGEVLPAIAKYGEYIAVRKDGISMRRFLTDAIKRQIDLKRMDEHAYPTITDVVYIIRYGMNSNQLRRHLGLEEGDNIREHLSQEELQALARIEDELAGLLNFGLKPEQVMTNKEFLSVHRKPL